MQKCFETVDFHSHILPSVDHGCADIHECRKQLGLIRRSGTDITVATPHFYPQEHEVAHFLKKVSRSLDKLQSSDIKSGVRVALGAEVLLCPNLHSMSDLEKLCIRGTNVLLLELPLYSVDTFILDTVDEIIQKGFTVVLAHIDRYLYEFEEAIDILLSMGAYAQINAESLHSSKTLKKIVYYLEQTEKICAVGSDLHGRDKSAYKKFVKAQRVLGEYYPSIMKRSQSLLKDAEILTF